jgi:PilX N-terminal
MSLSPLSPLTVSQRRLGNTHGIALISALMFVVLLALLGATTATVSTVASHSSGNYKATIQSLQSTEAGAEEARGRLRGNAVNRILDTAPTAKTWTAFIGSPTHAQAYGYTGSAQQVRTDSLQTALAYTVVITHATVPDPTDPTEPSKRLLLYWGDPTGTGTYTRTTTAGPRMRNIYLVTSYGTLGGATSIVQTQVAPVPPVTIPGTVYVDAHTTLQGSSTYITGQDQCGTQHLPGIVTPLPQTQDNQNTITQNGHPNVTGSPAMQYNGTYINITTLVNALKGFADSTYTFASNTTVTGMSWGTPTAGPTQTSPLTCSESHIVYYNMAGTSLKLSGGTQGCGILLVDGDLELHGGFAWYGPVLVTGSIIYTGGGNKNITGALLSGSSVTADVIGGNATILNCSAARTNATQNRPLLRLNWQQM